MKRKTSLLIFFFFLLNTLGAQQIDVLKFSELEPMLHKQNDTIYLVNFWASWCVPCVKEMPAIEKIAEEYKDFNFSVLLVSLDFPNQIESRLKPFLSKQNIRSKVILLDDPDFNKWIDKVNPNWSGAIPASLIYGKDFRDFYEQSFSYEELKSIIHSKIQEL
ncbi:MAG: TlpA family protein disulfide reductase [Bacteroidales bacterium]|nr:TlpA family protein disulfide reductase [Bacteroidales bacterium]MBN2820542.1 TlpA family protein disulfide reductase [Bacteroidales bacterium]